MEDALLDAAVARARALGSDDAHTEIKASVQALSKSIWDSVSAFANTAGGLIILGLDETKGFIPADGFDPGRITDALVAGLVGPEPKVTPEPQFDLDQGLVDDHPVVTLQIERAPGAGPCYVKAKGIQGGSYRRVDAQDIRLTPYEIYLLQTRTENTHLDRQPVPEATINDLDAAAIQAIEARLYSQNSQALTGTHDASERTRRLNIVTPQNIPTLAGLLCTAPYPQQFFPQLFIDVTVHPGREKGTLASTRFLDRVQCDGPIPVMIQNAVAAVLRNLRTARVIDGVRGLDVPEIPEDVLREAIVNAVMHRDYSDQALGQQVAVDVYSDRVVITNPGGFWGGISKETIFDGVSRSRNGTLARMLASVPFPSGGAVSENQGSGVARMASAMRDRGLPIPEFQETIGQVRVTLARIGPTAQPDEVSTPSIATPGPTTADAEVLAAITSEPQTIQELAESLNRSAKSLRPALHRLVASGSVTATAPATSRYRAYVLTTTSV